MKRARSLWHDQQGSALIEATVLIPVMLTVFLGVFEFSWYYFQQQVVETGIRDAARYMARIPITSTASSDPCTQVDGSDVSYKSYAANIAATGNPLSGGTARAKGWSASDITITCGKSAALSSGTYADGAASMTIIEVKTHFTNPSLGFFAFLKLAAPAILISHKERYIGPG